MTSILLKSTKLLLCCCFFCACTCPNSSTDYTGYVNKLIGSGGNGRVAPVASIPFGMMQLSADTRPNGSGYHYNDSSILGFSHLHKSGGGCADFLDILFLPLKSDGGIDTLTTLRTMQFRAPFSHADERVTPGYYGVDLYDGSLKVELTASTHCGLQRYTTKDEKPLTVAVDLEYGSQSACTIRQEHDVDTVYSAFLEQVDDYTLRGFRLSNGWAPQQQVYFYTRFSVPIRECRFFVDNRITPTVSSVRGCNLKAVLTFEPDGGEVEVQTAISAVDMDGARLNWQSEVKGQTFDSVHQAAVASWNAVLGQVEVETTDAKKRELFYTSLHNVMLYPMLFSDVDHRFRGPDAEVHQTDGFGYYGGVFGLWDTFRAACPLAALLRPDVMSDYVKTALEHYRYAGQLPIWTLSGMETYQMIGLHSLPMITNCYLSGIRDFDTSLALHAMITSAMKDTCGYSMGYFVGLENYKQLGYVPFDREMESVARTLEYAYDDHAVARFAALTGDTAVATLFEKRAGNYRNVIDPQSLLARGRGSDGSWRTPFDPFRSEHRKDDYCEGNAWQWTFFVPHDVEGLAAWMGGKEVLAARLDSLFTLPSALQGEDVSGDISGLIGQYAHGNEPGHHTIYMYNKVGQPRKTQHYINRVLTTLYNNTPEGICGNEDTGQMSAWYVFSALGFYPMDPVSGRYELGAPLFEKVTLHFPSKKDFVVEAGNLSEKNIYVKSVSLNGKQLDRTYLTFDEVRQGGTLRFEMTDR